MQFQHVCLESFGYCLPEQRVTSAEIEAQLAPLYSRLRLPEGRLELITGVRERRFWAPGTLPGDVSIRSGQLALQAAGRAPATVGALIHGSVCRDHLEPATACRVHHRLGLPAECLVYDLSNACLGLLTGVLHVAQMIEAGQIQAGLVVGSEGSRQLVETTMAALNANHQLTRQQVKSAIASLTIGSGSCAILLSHLSISRTRSRLLAAVARAHTQHHALCLSGADESVGGGMQPLMETDAERLLQAGIETGVETFDHLLRTVGWARGEVDRTVCHQVGTTHRRRMLEALEMPLDGDFLTVDWLGNTGSVALPLAMALAGENAFLRQGDRIAMLGIGSGLNSLMLAVEWQGAFVLGQELGPGGAAQGIAPRTGSAAWVPATAGRS